MPESKADKPVYLRARKPVSINAIKNVGGVIDYGLLDHMGGARVEKGQTIKVLPEVAAKLETWTYASQERSGPMRKRGKQVPVFSRELL